SATRPRRCFPNTPPAGAPGLRLGRGVARLSSPRRAARHRPPRPRPTPVRAGHELVAGWGCRQAVKASPPHRALPAVAAGLGTGFAGIEKPHVFGFRRLTRSYGPSLGPWLRPSNARGWRSPCLGPPQHRPVRNSGKISGGTMLTALSPGLAEENTVCALSSQSPNLPRPR